MKKIILTFLITISLLFSAHAGSESENSLSGKKNTNPKDCFEKVNRATFAFNNGLDKAILLIQRP